MSKLTTPLRCVQAYLRYRSVFQVFMQFAVQCRVLGILRGVFTGVLGSPQCTLDQVLGGGGAEVKSWAPKAALPLDWEARRHREVADRGESRV